MKTNSATRFLMKNKLNIILALAMLLMVALPACKNADQNQQSVDTATAPQQELLENPASQVVDIAGILNEQDIKALLDKTNVLDSLKLAQVAIVTVNDLEGKKAIDYATAIANKWGVGHKDTNDGITILVKPKTGDTPEGKGEATIATGTGMQKILTDSMCKSIIDKTMLPKFKENKYGEGISDALDKIKEILTNK